MITPFPSPGRATGRRPHIVYIVADDLGFADLGCYGGRDAPFGPVSPVLDKLAAAGLRLTQGYSNSPVCSPTRFALMTGRYQYRLRGAAEEPIRTNTRGNDQLGLPPSHPTLPSLLRKVGYHTALMGKWHLGYPPHFGPLRSGYDEFFGPMSGGVDYFTHCGSNGQHDLWFGEKEKNQEGYLTDLITDHSVDLIERHANEHGTDAQTPLFLSVHYTAPHWPWETRNDEQLAHELRGHPLYHLHGGSVATYQRMIHHMDEGIGRIRDTLAHLGMLNDTLIIFTSDNGGERFSDNWPLVGGKMDLTEGGIRVPWIAHWPACIAAGRVSTQQCLTMDWTATLLDAGNASPATDYPLDGISLLPLLLHAGADEPVVERKLYWRMNHRNQRALRQGPLKYLRVDDTDYLFNIEHDARERANLAPLYPDVLDAMRADWQAWHTTMPAIAPDATVSLCYTHQDMPQR